MKAVLLVRKGWGVRKVSRHLGFSHGAILNWIKKAPRDGRQTIPTRSSRPKHSPRSISKEIVGRIIAERTRSKRCAEVVYEQLKLDGVAASLSTVKRVLSRYGCLNKRSPWKKTRRYPIRPGIEKQGDLVEMDTIHFVDKEGKRTYVYTAIDVYSRYGFAMRSEKSNCQKTVSFMKKVVQHFPFSIFCIQTDNGPEFGLHFTDSARRQGISHRHNHPRSPNENGHLERFNRTIQEEMPRDNLCIFIEKDIATYVKKYNTERMHMGIQYKTPKQKLEEVVTRS